MQQTKITDEKVDLKNLDIRLTCLIRYFQKNKEIQVSVKELAKMCGVSIRRMQYDLKELEENGYIKGVPVFTKGGKNKANMIIYVDVDWDT